MSTVTTRVCDGCGKELGEIPEQYIVVKTTVVSRFVDFYPNDFEYCSADCLSYLKLSLLAKHSWLFSDRSRWK